MGSDALAKADKTGVAQSRWKLAYGLNMHKAMCGPVIFVILSWFNIWTPGSRTYLTLHGTYGLLWGIKDLIFPDKSFHKPCTFAEVIMVFTFCSVMYWWYPVSMVLTGGGVTNDAVCHAVTAMFCFGSFLMNCSDCQKTFTLQCQPKKLITNGFFKYIRSPNYLGEVIVYASFPMLVGGPWAWIPNIISCVMFYFNMVNKDRSMSRYPEFEAWKSSTYMVLPLFL
ncbi:unnamed protein product [Ascophyllum nodosum]